jgi:integrase
MPLSLAYGRQENAERRLLILRQNSLRLFKKFKITEGASTFLEQASNVYRHKKDLLEYVNRMISGIVLTCAAPPIEAVIDAARAMGALQLPSVVLAGRSRRIVSHALPPESLGRIGNWKLTPFPIPKSQWSGADDSYQDDPGFKEAADSGDEPAWLTTLRQALDIVAIDYSLLDKLEADRSEAGQILSKYARYLDKSQKSSHPWYGRGDCQPVTVRRYCLLIATSVIPRLGGYSESDRCPAQVITSDAWEDAIEQVMDEDAFYQIRKYTKTPKSNAQSHSRPLVKALRHWLKFLQAFRLEQAKEETYSASAKSLATEVWGLVQPEDRQELEGLQEIGRRLPPLGLVKVDASLITVDEYKKALQSMVGKHGIRTSKNDLEAARVALILGYRCGLRRKEAAGLCVSDLDRLDYLHVRANEMRPLKTSNAARDLPLALLMPEDELAHVRRRFSAIARRAGDMPLSRAYVFSEADRPGKAMYFENVVRNIHTAFHGHHPRQWPEIDKEFRYHRLRHSFANMMLLKLWPDLRRIAQKVFSQSRHPET